MNFKAENFRIVPGMLVEGIGSKSKVYRGKVMESYKRPGKPAIFQRYGFVGCYCMCEDGVQRALTELKPVQG